MKRLMNRVKKYFTAKPKKDFWRWAFITLLLFNYFSPTALVYLTMFQIGLVAPTQDFDILLHEQSQVAAQRLLAPMTRLLDAGQEIGNDNPVFAQIMFYGLGALVWSIWGMMLFLMINLARYGISSIYRRISRSRRNK